jgi:hypothetical protein
MRFIALLAAIFAITSTLDFSNKIQQASSYQEMVCSGAWPDYKALHPEC